VSRIIGGWILGVRRIGKEVIIDVADGPDRPADRWCGVHLRMTGRLLVQGAGDPPNPRPRARFELADGRAVEFADTRRFGTIRVVTDPAELEIPGLDPLSPRFTAAQLGQLIGTSSQPIKVWLLRQDRLVGLGNIYACEICHAARIHPARPARDLSAADLVAVHRHTRRILRRAIANCGTTFADFQDAHGLTGSYQQYLQVYARAGEPCRRCSGPARDKPRILRIVQAGRSTFYCPGCQPD
jgi:formamidopyrimidine-DNA glycosylase